MNYTKYALVMVTRGRKKLDTPFFDINSIEIDPSLRKLVPYSLAKRHHLVPIQLKGEKLIIAMDNPLNHVAIEDVRMTSQLDVFPVVSYKEAITYATMKLYGNDTAERAILAYQKETKTDAIYEDSAVYNSDSIMTAPIIRLIDSIIEEAVAEAASDIHIEPSEDSIRVRYRIDGRLQIKMNIPKSAHSAMITRIKIMSKLNISEKRLPQDGRLEETFGSNKIDMRISIIPTIHGEKAVLRILNRSAILYTKDQLGFTLDNSKRYDELLLYSHGIILVTGPTGSGKTTTLYAMLNQLNTQDNNIITIENPIEYILDGINQIQVNNKIGFDFAFGLKAILRQDPDIIMVGEIRDEETAEIALRAAITGHLVLTTLHTNDATSAIFRLRDMGIPLYMIAAAVNGIISQRLLRKLCIHCSQSYEYEGSEQKTLGIKKYKVLRKAVGCGLCNNTGYKGRIAIHEFLVFNEEYRSLIQQGGTMDTLRQYTISNGMNTIKDECIRLLDSGITTLEEVYKAVYSQNYL